MPVPKYGGDRPHRTPRLDTFNPVKTAEMIIRQAYLEDLDPVLDYLNEGRLPATWADDLLAESYRRNVERESQKPPLVPEKNRQSMLWRQRTAKITANVVLAATLLYGGVRFFEQKSEVPIFSPETTTYTLQPGEGILQAVEQVSNPDGVDMSSIAEYIEKEPGNSSLFVSGTSLHAGDSLIIPVSVRQQK